MGEEENTIKKYVLQYLNKIGFFWNVNNGMFKGKYRMGKKGSGDIQGTGRYKKIQVPLHVETKTPEEDLRESQILFRTKWVLAGGCYICARNVNDVITGLDHFVLCEKKRLGLC